MNTKTTILIVLVLVLLDIAEFTMAGSTNGPIHTVVSRLADDHFWRNGTFPVINLPNTATPDAVLAHLFKMITFGESSITSFKIRETTNVTIRGSLPDTYTAVFVDTDLGHKIVLLQYIKPDRWWTKVYDAETRAEPTVAASPSVGK